MCRRTSSTRPRRRCCASAKLGALGQAALVLFSDSDPIFSPAYAERLAALIPGAGPAEIVAGAGHFLQEDKGEEIADRIVRFLT